VAIVVCRCGFKTFNPVSLKSEGVKVTSCLVLTEVVKQPGLTSRHAALRVGEFGWPSGSLAQDAFDGAVVDLELARDGSCARPFACNAHAPEWHTQCCSNGYRGHSGCRSLRLCGNTHTNSVGGLAPSAQRADGVWLDKARRFVKY
jgi:hypothetical protein